MEWTLHRQLKEIHALGGRSEVVVDAFRVDAIAADGRLIEVQAGPLGRLKGKLARLLPEHRVVVVKPIVVRRRILRRDRRTGLDLGARRSPKRGSLSDAFDELVSLAKLLPDPNLRIDLLAVDVDEVRVARSRRPGFDVVDRLLGRVIETVPLRDGSDLWRLLPGVAERPFTTDDLAAELGRSLGFARKVAYCLRHSGAASMVDMAGRRRVYARTLVPCRTPELSFA